MRLPSLNHTQPTGPSASVAPAAAPASTACVLLASGRSGRPQSNAGTQRTASVLYSCSAGAKKMYLQFRCEVPLLCLTSSGTVPPWLLVQIFHYYVVVQPWSELLFNLNSFSMDTGSDRAASVLATPARNDSTLPTRKYSVGHKSFQACLCNVSIQRILHFCVSIPYPCRNIFPAKRRIPSDKPLHLRDR